MYTDASPQLRNCGSHGEIPYLCPLFAFSFFIEISQLKTCFFAEGGEDGRPHRWRAMGSSQSRSRARKGFGLSIWRRPRRQPLAPSFVGCVK